MEPIIILEQEGPVLKSRCRVAKALPAPHIWVQVVLHTHEYADRPCDAQGLCRMTKAEFREPLPAVRLWVHECERVLGDRLVSDTDRAKFGELRLEVTKKHFANLPLVRYPATLRIRLRHFCRADCMFVLNLQFPSQGCTHRKSVPQILQTCSYHP